MLVGGEYWEGEMLIQEGYSWKENNCRRGILVGEKYWQKYC